MSELEEREQRQALELAMLLGAESDGFDTEDVEVSGAADAAMAVLGAFGNVPDLKPEFDSTLRARLVRQASKKSRPASVTMSKWKGMAVAAALMVLFVPTVMMMREKLAMESKVEALEKYDKMYVPYSERLRRGETQKYRIAAFSQSHRNRVRDMALETARRRTAEYFESYRHERRHF